MSLEINSKIYKKAPEGFGTHTTSDYALENLNHTNEANYSGIHAMIKKARESNINPIDIACLGIGNGLRDLELIFPIARNTEAAINIIGLDINESALRESIVLINQYSTEYSIDNVNHQMYVADLRKEIPLETNSVDMAISRYSFHWLGHKAQSAIAEMVRILKPGGIGLLTVATPHDVVTGNQVYDGEKYTREQVATLHPNADNINKFKSKLTGKKLIDVLERIKIRRMIRESSNGIVINSKHNNDRAEGVVEMAGFTPRFFIEQLPILGAELIQYTLTRNDTLKNGKKRSVYQKGKSRFSFITAHFKKNI